MKQFMPGVPPKERTMLLQENASKVEQTNYQKLLTDEELAARREDFSDNSIQLSIIEDEFDVVKEDFKARMNPIKDKNKTLLGEIKTKQTTVDGTLYHIANHDEGMMETYDAEGFLISSRRLRPEEKQGHLYSLGKTNSQ